MKTEHKTVFSDSKDMTALPNESVDLMVTSPPYPMIEMWDESFFQQDPSIKTQMDSGDGVAACEKMHTLLDRTWKEACRVLKTGGFACINIGDATRTIKGEFSLYTNHARILRCVQELGFSSLPCILWRKQTNAPNKFMGSGMLPAGAYVTLEHEYILVLRKGPKRAFKSEADKANRRESALFWEERNQWFSDLWLDLKGTPQALNDKSTRKRSAAYPFDLAYRLINMYSAKNDLVLDPFSGMGTTALAAMASGRNSFGYEIDASFKEIHGRLGESLVETSQQVIRKRLQDHVNFVRERIKNGGRLKHRNIHYGFPVISAQEKEILINAPISCNTYDNKVIVSFSQSPQAEFCHDWSEYLN